MWNVLLERTFGWQLFEEPSKIKVWILRREQLEVVKWDCEVVFDYPDSSSAQKCLCRKAWMKGNTVLHRFCLSFVYAGWFSRLLYRSSLLCSRQLANKYLSFTLLFRWLCRNRTYSGSTPRHIHICIYTHIHIPLGTY